MYNILEKNKLYAIFRSSGQIHFIVSLPQTSSKASIGSIVSNSAAGVED